MWTGPSGRLLDSELACSFKTGMKDTATSCITARCKGIGVQIAEWLPLVPILPVLSRSPNDKGRSHTDLLF